MADRTVSLTELVDSSLTVELNGKEYPVKPIDGFGYQLIASMKGEQSVDAMYKVAARCLAPGMTRDEVFGSEDVQGLTAQQVAKVVQLASAKVEEVEALASPNSEQAGNKRSGKRPSSPV